MNIEERVEYAKSKHLEKYNCCQCLLLAYKDYFDVPEEQLMKMSMGLGKGVGGCYEICGCALGASMVISQRYGISEGNEAQKHEVEAHIQPFIEEFKETYGAVTCGELRKVRPCVNEIKKPSCHQLIAETVVMLEKYL